MDIVQRKQPSFDLYTSISFFSFNLRPGMAETRNNRTLKVRPGYQVKLQMSCVDYTGTSRLHIISRDLVPGLC